MSTIGSLHRNKAHMKKIINHSITLIFFAISLSLSCLDNSPPAWDRGPLLPTIKYGSEFRHSPHLNTRSNAECTACHRVKTDGACTTLFTCQVCHVREKFVEVTTTMRERRVYFAPFPHNSHLKKGEACTDCHQHASDSKELYAPVAFASCKKCHRKHETALARYQEGKNCNDCHFQKDLVASLKRDSYFKHVTHLRNPNPQSWAKEACLSCHSGIMASSLGDTPINFETCRACHLQIQDDGEKGPWNKAWKEQKSHGFIFEHSKHLKHGESCSLCHNLIRDGKMDFRQPDALTYKGCVTCHKNWVVPTHSNLDVCWKCHDRQQPTHPANLAIEVNRTKLGLISLFARTCSHAKEHSTSEECRKCHVKGVRTGEAETKHVAFLHAQHLEEGEVAGKLNEQCVKCHNKVMGADNSSLEIFSQTNLCQKCHDGQTFAYQTHQESYRRPLFNHKEHLKVKDGCVACHTMNTATKTTAEQYSCKTCHDHHKQKDVTPHRLDQCFHCHLPGQVWKKDQQNRRVIMAVSTTPPTYRHSNQGKCRACHVTETTAIERSIIDEVTYRNDPHLKTIPLNSCPSCHAKLRGKK